MTDNPLHYSGPLVSVIIPTYNSISWLPLTLESVFKQVYPNFEVIVVNDGSTDETGDFLASYGERIHLITQTNAGLSAARNCGIHAALGEMVAFLDADDLWFPEMLSKTVNYLQEEPDIDLVCGAWDFIDGTGRAIQPVSKPSLWRASVDTNFLRTIVLGTFFPVHALLIRRLCFDSCGFFDTSLQALEDWDLWLRFAIYGFHLGLIDVPVARYRRHGGCMTLDLPRMEHAFQQVLGKVFANEQIALRVKDLEIHAYIFEWLNLALYCQEAGEDDYLRKCIQEAEALFPEAPPKNDLNLRYYCWASRLPYTDHFRKMLHLSSPNLEPNFFWLDTKNSFKKKEYRFAMAELFNMLWKHPGWMATESLQKIKDF